jgi:hypothetical protein
VYAVVLGAVGGVDAEDDEREEADDEEEEDREEQRERPETASNAGVAALLAGEALDEHAVRRPDLDGVGQHHVRLLRAAVAPRDHDRVHRRGLRVRRRHHRLARVVGWRCVGWHAHAHVRIVRLAWIAWLRVRVAWHLAAWPVWHS